MNEELIDAAVQIIFKDGLGTQTITALAKWIEALVSSVYHRFPSRDASFENSF